MSCSKIRRKSKVNKLAEAGYEPTGTQDSHLALQNLCLFTKPPSSTNS